MEKSQAHCRQTKRWPILVIERIAVGSLTFRGLAARLQPPGALLSYVFNAIDFFTPSQRREARPCAEPAVAPACLVIHSENGPACAFPSFNAAMNQWANSQNEPSAAPQ
jgi:hypothetical protein